MLKIIPEDHGERMPEPRKSKIQRKMDEVKKMRT